jgi:hypothetical protein
MTRFVAEVTETITQTVRYIVEADSQEEAAEKASIGDTIDEEVIRTNGVLARDLISIEPCQPF